MTHGRMADVAIVILAVTLMAGVGMTFLPMDPVQGLRLTVVGETRAGGPVCVRVDYCKTRDIKPESVAWNLVDGVVIILPPSMVILPNGCHSKTILLPTSPHMTPGVYRLEVVATYAVLPWRDVLIHGLSQPFTVMP